MKRAFVFFYWLSEKGEYVLAVFGAVLGIWMASYMFFSGLTRVLTDQSAHLNFAKLVTESATPGISQLGFWPPLLHILMVPIVGMYESLYRSGLAGFVVLLPFAILGAIFLYRTILLLTKQKMIAFTGALVFLLNPYVLYYTATPMMEVLFLANLAGVAYFFTRWIQEQKLAFLILAAVFVMLATISRYEGFILIPLGALLVFFALRQQKKSAHEIEALLVLFTFLSSWGVALVLLYSWIYGGTPLAFLGGWWIRDPEYFPTQHNLFLSFQYALHASFYVIGKPFVLFAIGGIPVLFALFRKNMVAAAALLLLLSPFFMVLISLFRGSPPIMVPDLPPFDLFFNERYGLTWIGFSIVFSCLTLSFLYNRVSRISFAWARGFAVFGCGVLLLFSGMHLYQKVFVEDFQEIRWNLGIDSEDQEEITKRIVYTYDYGKILVTRTINDALINEAGIPLHGFIFEANDELYRQTMAEPWLFARWVVMAKEQEPIFDKWEDSEIFHSFYNVVMENNTRKLYKVNEEALARIIQEHGYDASVIPSLRADKKVWDTKTIYSDIRNEKLVEGEKR